MLCVRKFLCYLFILLINTITLIILKDWLKTQQIFVMGSNVNKNSSDNQYSYLKRPKSPPRVAINEWGFKNLTNAEKLNDGRYRNLIYRAYPNEPTCKCKLISCPTNLTCREGCPKSYHTNLKNSKMNQEVKNKPASASDLKSMSYGIQSDNVMRIRGGASANYSSVNPEYNNDLKYIWKNKTSITRLQGGTSGNVEAFNNKNTKSRCSCPAKSGEREKNPNSIKKPCFGADCLIRAFQEAQEFVDSLGKVPGLASLGLMDPSESPYFGRDLDKDYSSLNSPIEDCRVKNINDYQNDACSKKNIPSGMNFRSEYFSPTTPGTIAIPGRTGIVREAPPNNKMGSIKFKESNLSTPYINKSSPCGELKCKSQRKIQTTPSEVSKISKKDDQLSTNETSGKVKKFDEILPKVTKNEENLMENTFVNTGLEKETMKFKKRIKKSTKPNSQFSEDQYNVDKSSIKVSRPVMQHVYSMGDAYPGIHFGHKNCMDPRIRIPARMGWLWNTVDLFNHPRIGWKPGAIGRHLNKVLQKAKTIPLKVQIVKKPKRGGVQLRMTSSMTSRTSDQFTKKIAKTSSSAKNLEVEAEEDPPTLHILRKSGIYYVTMYPVKPESSDTPQLAEPTKPLQFKIMKNEDDDSDSSGSTVCDLDVGVSTPAAVNKYRKRPDVVHVDTQVKQQEIIDATKPPQETNKNSTTNTPAAKKEKKAKKNKK